MTEENKAAVRSLYEEALNRGDLAVLDDIYAPDVELHIPGVPEDPFGPAPVRQLLAMIRAAFPGVQAAIEDLVAEGDKVVARVTLHRPHDGHILGLAPQSPLAAWPRIDIFRLFRGRIVEQWADRDDAGLLQQLGVVPPPIERDDPVLAQGFR